MVLLCEGGDAVRIRLGLALSLVCFSLGCFRTHYVNFSVKNPERVQQYLPVRASGWQSFYLYGWVPGERVIDARARCGGEEKVHSIWTQQTFLEGLVESVAGFYINVYAPWDGAVYCTEKPPAKQRP